MPGKVVPSPHGAPGAPPPRLTAAPWWVLALGVVYTSYFILLTSFEVRAPRLPAKPDPATAAVILDEPAPGSVAASAGLRRGDRVLDVEGRAVVDILDWDVAVAHFSPARPVELTVEREGRAVHATVNPPSWGRARFFDMQALFFVASLRLPALAMALLLVWRRPRDPQALVGAWLTATMATAQDMPREGMAAAWQALPRPVGAVFWIPYASGFAFFPAIGLTFAAVFPRPLVRRAWTWALLWTPAVLTLAWLVPVLARAAADGRTGPGDLQHVLRAGPGPFGVLYLVGSLAALAVGYRRLIDPNEKRRVRVLLGAGAVTALAALPVNLLQTFVPSPHPAGRGLALVASLFEVVFPLALAYAVLRHRVFDLRLVVRAGVRYALARRTLLALVPTIGGLLVVDLLRHGDEPLLDAVSRRGWIYAGLAALALVARRRQKDWLDALDRRFFRARFDGFRLLREVTIEVARAASPTEAGARAVTAIESALHPEFTALLREEPHDRMLLAVAAAPAGRDVTPWPADSRLLGVLEVLGAPLPVASSPAVLEGLPAEEVERLERTGVDLVVPIPGHGRKAVLVLGRKRSEEPWDREERELVAAVAAALGPTLRAEEPATAAASPAPAFHDRYRLDRPLGSGGMGVVFDAFDRELHRRVAIKFLREDRAGLAGYEDRFRREAQALAAFSHPNVVTIHDAGVGRDGRAFLVMERLEGPTLRDLLRQEGSLKVPRALGVLDGVAAAVEAAHRRGIVHRDLKPDNVILAQGETGEVPKVLDFGLARLLPAGEASEQETATRGLAGTPRYMAPEQLSGGVVESSWDVWALTVMAYEMLTGEHPFGGDEERASPSTWLAGRPHSVRLREGGSSPSLDSLFSQALDVHKDSRPSSPTELVGRLRQAVGA